MTRINVVPVEELSDQHLIAEYRELPRAVKQNFDLTDAPKKYVLGKGHVKWARKHIHYVLLRYHDIYYEMLYRNFKPNYTFNDLLMYATADWYREGLLIIDDYYQVTDKDIQLNRQRLIEKYKLKPNFYRWTKRNKPEWILKGE